MLDLVLPMTYREDNKELKRTHSFGLLHTARHTQCTRKSVNVEIFIRPKGGVE